MLDRDNKGHSQCFLDHLIFVRKAHIPNLRLRVPFLHVEKFVVGDVCYISKQSELANVLVCPQGIFPCKRISLWQLFQCISAP